LASAEELIREAQYACHNIGHGSIDERNFRARAKKYAKRIIRKYPASVEASQARTILSQLNVRVDIQLPPSPLAQSDAATDFKKDHAVDSGHTASVASTPVASSPGFQRAKGTDDWRGLFRRFVELPLNKKKILGIIIAIALFFPGGIFAVSGLVVFYALQTALLKKHLDLLLKRFGSE
jgi:hypothetical protein